MKYYALEHVRRKDCLGRTMYYSGDNLPDYQLSEFEAFTYITQLRTLIAATLIADKAKAANLLDRVNSISGEDCYTLVEISSYKPIEARYV